MLVEAWSPDLEMAVEQRFGQPAHWSEAQGRAQWGRMTQDGRWARTIVLIDLIDGRPVAVASGFRPRLHAQRDWCYVEVAPDVRGSGLGTQAFAALRSVAPDDVRPFRAKVAADSAGAWFAERHGLMPIQRNRTIRVAPGIRVRRDSAMEAEIVGVAHEVEDDVVDAWITYYRDGHDWDPPGEIPREIGRELFFSGNDNVVVVRRSGTIVGVGCIMRSGERPILVGGSTSRDDPDAVAIASALVDSTWKLTGSDGFDVELDDWMWEVDDALDSQDATVVDESIIVAEL